MANPKTKYISTLDLAKHLGCSDDVVLKRIQKGKIAAVKIGRSYAIPESYVKEYFPKYPVITSAQEGEYVSVMEAAKMLGLSRVAVFKRIKAGTLEAKRVGRHYVIAKDQVVVPVPGEDVQPAVEKDYLSVPELAGIMGVSRIYIFKQIQKGIIPAGKVGRHYAIAREDIPEAKGAKGAGQQKVPDTFKKETAPQEDYISLIEAARMLGISRIAVFKKIRKGQIEAIKIGRSFAIERQKLGLFLMSKNKEVRGKKKNEDEKF